jgi:hypothetical protein
VLELGPGHNVNIDTNQNVKVALGETIVDVVPLSHHSRFNALGVVSMITTRSTYLLAQVGAADRAEIL